MMTSILAAGTAAALMTWAGSGGILGTSDQVPFVSEAPIGSTDLERALRTLEGRWEGVLEYRDYQSDERVELPARASIDASDMGPTLTRRVEFVDPGRVVASTSVVRAEEGRIVEVDLSDGAWAAYRVGSLEFRDIADWSLTLEADQTDGGVDSLVRLVQVMKGDSFSSTKSVRPADQPDAPFEFRNETRLSRVNPDASALLGTWRVDLRPTPNDPPYLIDMVIESVDGGTVEGTFYQGSEMQGGAINTAWHDVHFAFTTSDGTGEYHTRGVLRNGRIEGATHSIGRDFLMPWRGEKVDGE